MGPLVGATELSKALTEAGNNLLKPHSSTDALLTLLNVRILLSLSPQQSLILCQFSRRARFLLLLLRVDYRMRFRVSIFMPIRKN